LFDQEKLPKKNIAERQQAFIARSFDGQTFYLQGQEAKKVAELLTDDDQAQSIIRGQVANKGPKVVGKVKIISVDYTNFREKIDKEIHKMEQGSILVAETTAPELILACKKAIAIITDMGGMMSHAAIVSRELGIPCIVGTKKCYQTIERWRPSRS